MTKEEHEELIDMSKDMQDWFKNPVYEEDVGITVTKIVSDTYVKPIDLLNKMRGVGA